jgi:hypothetical protein
MWNDEPEVLSSGKVKAVIRCSERLVELVLSNSSREGEFPWSKDGSKRERPVNNTFYED